MPQIPTVRIQYQRLTDQIKSIANLRDSIAKVPVAPEDKEASDSAIESLEYAQAFMTSILLHAVGALTNEHGVEEEKAAVAAWMAAQKPTGQLMLRPVSVVITP